MYLLNYFECYGHTIHKCTQWNITVNKKMFVDTCTVRSPPNGYQIIKTKQLNGWILSVEKPRKNVNDKFKCDPKHT